MTGVDITGADADMTNHVMKNAQVRIYNVGKGPANDLLKVPVTIKDKDIHSALTLDSGAGFPLLMSQDFYDDNRQNLTFEPNAQVVPKLVGPNLEPIPVQYSAKLIDGLYLGGADDNQDKDGCPIEPLKVQTEVAVVPNLSCDLLAGLPLLKQWEASL